LSAYQPEPVGQPIAAAPQPGWYTDPNDTRQQRWWDGTSWSETVRSAPPPQTLIPGAVAPQARGWYPDPDGSRRERWWTGTEWSHFTHRAPRWTLLGPEYARSSWAGPNRDALIGSVVSRVGLGMWCLAVVIQAVSASRNGGLNLSGLLPVVVVIALVGVVFSIRGIMKAPKLGANILSIYGIVIGVLTLVSAVAGALVIAAQ
jgi:hypothetical protein